ncbi:NAD(+)--dinitrogen-reductase ADP-D-ribosyltransferase [Thiorhodococcus mannitoliphagus]|uniref:NAD(+)--dinitrogen-reductase ADP-D-ribosyltransferase n=1 Tax=Thiorhodococcus mannitoliphagus TaxID=329406 RepID=A0A6P1DVC6_9GAMM|nr:NAD(+)--dinitrogen-reductase ADP-D-ribosyltransferase [Thiorhodococcus mannitoliphagus]NEX20012.1 NAD(+)--dinitrogen-reductase ADP-D-ribosyltransferase [Thiorhodococcus mannitoliphagus]
MDNNRQIEQDSQPPPSLPASARLPINRCNLPAVILGSLTFQAHPVPLEIDGIRDFHDDLFATLDATPEQTDRAQGFMDYMTVHFLLEELEEAGLTPGRKRKSRVNANYLRMVRGWSFDSDGREGAVLKRWVESRFGLLARHHAGSLVDRHSDAYHQYLLQGTRGLYATNALEAQLDLLYTYCQCELAREHSDSTHITLYRGINRMDEHEVLETRVCGRHRVLLNNLNSFTSNRERADEFGDYILVAEIPLPKVFFYNRLLPGMLKGEDEYVVIGGAYEVCISTI